MNVCENLLESLQENNIYNWPNAGPATLASHKRTLFHSWSRVVEVAGDSAMIKFGPFRYHYPPRRYNNTRVAKYRKLSFWKLNVHTEKVHVRLPGSRRHTTREYRSVQENGGLLNQAQSCIGMQRWKKYYDCVVGRFKQRRLESAVAAISSCQKNCVIMPPSKWDVFQYSILILNGKIGSCKVSRPKWSKKRLCPKRNRHQSGFLLKKNRTTSSLCISMWLVATLWKGNDCSVEKKCRIYKYDFFVPCETWQIRHAEWSLQLLVSCSISQEAAWNYHPLLFDCTSWIFFSTK